MIQEMDLMEIFYWFHRHPELSYEEFLEFHRTYYHPSNSYIYLYGNMDMTD